MSDLNSYCHCYAEISCDILSSMAKALTANLCQSKVNSKPLNEWINNNPFGCRISLWMTADLLPAKRTKKSLTQVLINRLSQCRTKSNQQAVCLRKNEACPVCVPFVIRKLLYTCQILIISNIYYQVKSI